MHSGPGRVWSEYPPATRRQLALEQIHKFFGDEQALHPVEIVEQDWSKEEFSGGCPCAFVAPGTLTQFGGDELRRPMGNIHFAGTETATVWCGYMDGAVQSGERAAEEVIAKHRDTYQPPPRRPFPAPRFESESRLLRWGLLALGAALLAFWFKIGGAEYYYDAENCGGKLLTFVAQEYQPANVAGVMISSCATAGVLASAGYELGKCSKYVPITSQDNGPAVSVRYTCADNPVAKFDVNSTIPAKTTYIVATSFVNSTRCTENVPSAVNAVIADGVCRNSSASTTSKTTCDK
ncbi:hypothetical protein HK102_005091, partial [Quaeritorhiza haematococci]